MSATEDRGTTWTSSDERRVGAQLEYESVMTTRGPGPTHAYYEAGVIGFVFGEMWPRSGLTRKERRWVTLSCVCAAGVVIPIQTHVYAALNSGDCTLDEVDEFGLHVATQLGWPKGQNVNMYLLESTARVANERNEPTPTPNLTPWADPTDLATRVARGRAAFREVMLAEPPPATTTFRELGYFAFLYGEVWTRPGLSRKERRIVSICCAAAVGSARELDMHLSAALRSGDLTYEELQELVLHYAVYFGWLPGAELDDALVAAHERVSGTKNA
ncbi:MAG: carboxymuconolactone decarboxylase family protein [Actinobacteria bacterium]|nr:carboxymuconolactone decarboxylase family protein [Actinomycetota bacterium]